MVRTYNCKDILMSMGTHSFTGSAEDGFITIEADGGGFTKKTGCDGETVRSTSPVKTAKVTIKLMYGSPSIAWAQKRYDADQKNGSQMSPLSIRDLKGGLKFSAAQAWIQKPPNREFGKESGEYEIVIDTGDATWEGENTR